MLLYECWASSFTIILNQHYYPCHEYCQSSFYKLLGNTYLGLAIRYQPRLTVLVPKVYERYIAINIQSTGESPKDKIY